MNDFRIEGSITREFLLLLKSASQFVPFRFPLPSPSPPPHTHTLCYFLCTSLPPVEACRWQTSLKTGNVTFKHWTLQNVLYRMVSGQSSKKRNGSCQKRLKWFVFSEKWLLFWLKRLSFSLRSKIQQGDWWSFFLIGNHRNTWVSIGSS